MVLDPHRWTTRTKASSGTSSCINLALCQALSTARSRSSADDDLWHKGERAMWGNCASSPDSSAPDATLLKSAESAGVHRQNQDSLKNHRGNGSTISTPCPS
jgi:hypothetical protein